MTNQMRRWYALAIVLIACFCGGCSAKQGPDRGGLMLIVDEDGPLGLDRLHIDVGVGGTLLSTSDYRVPQDTGLPTSLAIVSNGDPALTVSITVVGFKADVPLDRRDAIVTEVPIDRVATVRIVLSARCKTKVTVDGSGRPLSVCSSGSTCDPATGGCVGATVGASTLPTFDGALDATAPGVAVDGTVSADAPSARLDGSVAAPDGDASGGMDVGGDSGSDSGGDGPVLPAEADVPCSAGLKRCGGQCVSINDPGYGCGITSCDPSGCPDAGAGALACKAGACVIGTCPSGSKNCGGQCVATSDPAFGCGAATCDNSSCPAAGSGTLACQAGACVIGRCGPGTKKCGSKCVSLSDPTFGCGASTCDASSCPVPGAGTLVCQAGACVIGVCGPGTKKCGSKCVPTDTNNGCSDPAVCTACAASDSCVGSPVSSCACVPDNVTACTNKNCGTATNNCGATVSCGSCTLPQTCGGAATPNKCGCTPIDPCTAGKCGTFDNGCRVPVACGCSSLLTCNGGTCGCPAGRSPCPGGCVDLATDKNNCGTCGHACVLGCSNRQCACVPDNVAACANKNCGTATNNCGATVSCGSCTLPESCGGKGVANQCGCTASNPCTGTNCGSLSDGCNGTTTCTCTAPQTSCNAAGGRSGQCICTGVDPCTGGRCGPLSDGCTIKTCMCASGQVCGGGGKCVADCRSVTPPTITGPSSFCSGGSATLTANASNAVSYAWSNGSTQPSITVTAGNTYSVRITDANGCSATSAPFPVTQTVPTGSKTFSFIGSPQFWPVPACATSAAITIAGGSGGAGAGPGGATAGGLGDVLGVRITVTPGDRLQIDVGGAGASNCQSSGAGGWPNGGRAGCGASANEGGGGGTSRVLGPTGEDLVYAAGGGGAGDQFGDASDNGGAGGLPGGVGTPGLAMGAGAFGSSGGVGGTFAPEFGIDPPAGDGAPPKAGGIGGQGGTGGACTNDPSGVQAHLGGGGGGGYAGGGGGCLQGGGGGSSFVHPTLGTQLSESATNSGAGTVTIQWR